MTKKIALITDSTCDLPQEYLDKYNIQVVPLTIVWGKDQFRDGVDLSPDEFYNRLESDPVIPTTSQPTPQEMVQVYEKARDNGAEEIVILTISSAMSGTYTSAKKAAAWCQYLESHAHRIYGAAINPVIQNAKTILERRKKLPSTFKARDIRDKGWAGLSETSDIKSALFELMETGHLFQVDHETSHQGGRPGRSYYWNPKLDEGNHESVSRKC